LAMVLSSGKWKPFDDGWSPLALLLNIISLFQENAEVAKTPLVANTLSTALSHVFDRETELEDSSLLWNELSRFIFALIQNNLLAAEQLKDCSKICLQTLLRSQAAYFSQDKEASGFSRMMKSLPDLVQLGAILCALLAHLLAVDCSSALDLPTDVVLFFLEYDQEIADVVCSDPTLTALRQLSQATANPALETVVRLPSSHVTFNLLHYSRETSGRDLIGILLERFSNPLRPRHAFSPETIFFALKIVRCESTDHLYVNKLTCKGFLNLLTLLSTGGADESPPLWKLCQLAFNLLAGLTFSPFMPHFL
jgi:hypothetical protein